MTKRKENPQPGGRPSDFDALVNLDQLRYLLEVKGFTDQELADFYGKSRTTITNWKTAHPEFLATIKLGKDAADAKVERSLFECATGYSHPDTHLAVCEGVVVMTPIIKHYKPDNTAQIFWLKNRKPGAWRDKTEVQDDRLTALLLHMNRTKEAQDGKTETRKPPDRTGGKRPRPGPGTVRPRGGVA